MLALHSNEDGSNTLPPHPYPGESPPSSLVCVLFCMPRSLPAPRHPQSFMLLRLLAMGLTYQQAFDDAVGVCKRLCRTESFNVCMFTSKPSDRLVRVGWALR